ncbi:MAG: hypothetical protein ACYST6_07960 [Planctomycetota bacterium]
MLSSSRFAYRKTSPSSTALRREKVADAPQILYDTFAAARDRIKAAQQQHGDYISPFDLMTK